MSTQSGKSYPTEFPESREAHSFFATGVDGMESPEGRWSKGQSMDGKGEFTVVKSEPIGHQELSLGAARDDAFAQKEQQE